jgi:hypothetical protein
VALPNSPIIIGYGSVRWGTLCDTIAMTVKPVLDGAQRSVKWTQYDFTLRFVVGEDNQAEGETSDDAVADIRAELMRVGLEFHYLNVGFGALQHVPGDGITFGLPSESRDVVWGPRPTSLQYRPMGNQSAEMTWSCTVCLAPCPEDALYDDGMIEYVWRVSYGIDQSGYTTRTTSGYARVMGQRTFPDSRTITDQADRLREMISPPLQPGFRRIPGTFTLSDDKVRMDFSITDVEAGPNYPPPGCVEASAQHTVTAGEYFTLLTRGTLSATYELSREVRPATAEKWFRELIEDRVIRNRNKAFKDLNGKPYNASVFMQSLEYGDPEIYGKPTASFRLEYRLTASVNAMLEASGIWRPVPNTDWARWSASLANSAFHVRGNNKMTFQLGDEAVIDICNEPQIPGRVHAPPRKPPGGDPPPNPRGKLRNDTPDPGTSWLHYYCWLRVFQTDETIELKPLPKQPPTKPPSSGGSRPRGGMEGIGRPGGDPIRELRTAPGNQGDPLGGFTKAGYRGAGVQPIADAPRAMGETAAAAPAAGGAGGAAAAAAGASVIQRRAPSTWWAVLEGFAARAGHPIKPPTLISVGGVEAIDANQASKGDGFSHGVACVWMGCPVYYCRWQFRYILPSRPDGELTVPGNPFLGL